MTTFLFHGTTGLFTLLLCHTIPSVADPSTLVHTTQQLFITRQATGYICQVTGNIVSLFMFSHTPLLSEVGTRWALLLAVAVVKNWMITLVLPGTWIFTFRWSCTAGNGWIDHCFTTVTCQFIKTGLPARVTVPTMTKLLTPMLSAVQLVPTDHGTFVLFVHTAKFVTLVAATRTFFIATLVTHEHKVSFILDNGTWKFFSSEATSAFDGRSKRARTTFLFMAKVFT